jgi:gluconate 2-dehydrogenase gamma chain
MENPNEKKGISRRSFMRGVVIATSSIPIVAAGCAPEATVAQPPAPTLPPQPLNPDVPLAPTVTPSQTVLRTFTPHEARTVEALTARILPGTPDDPGAREAGVVNYIDNMLAYREGFNESTYREPPYAQIAEEAQDTQISDPYQTVLVSADQIERYGFQAILSPREVYRLGVMGVDAYARQLYQKPFASLSEDEQDRIVEAMVNGDADDAFAPFTGRSFFTILRRHTAEGMFSDPAYGGNRNMVGWQLIGYPGAQRAYTPNDIRTETNTPRPPQSLAMLHPFSPGEYAGDIPVLPVSGSEEQFPVHHNHP